MMAMTNNDDVLKGLEPLLGEWRLMAVFKDIPPADIGARVNFEWLPGKQFLIQRWDVPVLERTKPDFSPFDFSQRFTGTLSEDGNTIAGAWEICHDGKTWEHDFDLTYTKVQ